VRVELQAVYAIVALADALRLRRSQFENKEANVRTLRKRIEALIAKASAEEFQQVYLVTGLQGEDCALKGRL
jgi:cysteine sulfinate desulfinase/cysteine desulfurase-like protein